ncbi:hypothetical protein Tsubulata_031452 [Turnera subulata]|uniref:Glycosyltransferase n=1 Tax=Turnera subulata TaxID=218843 RepID=A0A9Q0JR07_9ROSI|nr:hypothetical protein Tsubulata_031452 [Turnera subulata]
MEKARIGKHSTVVLFPCPYQGHITPMLQLGSALHSKGFSITVVHTQFNSPNPSSHPEFNFQSLPDGLSQEVISSGSLLDIISELNVTCKAPFQECLEQMVKARNVPNDDDKVIWVIYDELMHFAEAAANHLGLPTILLRTISAATFVSRSAILQLEAQGLIPFQESISEEAVPNLPSLRFKDLPISMHGVSEKFLNLMKEACHSRKPSAVVWNTIECLEQSLLAQLQKQSKVPIFPIGPIHKFAPAASCSSLLPEDTCCISWLNKQPDKSVVYASFGSVASIDAKEFTEMAWGLANSRHRFLWVVRPGFILGSEWTEPLPKGVKEIVGERCCIVKWAPQREVLGHAAVGVFLTHCGWNSALESISEGVPMICRPYFGDQKVTARYIAHVWGLGLQLENKLDREEVARAVRRIMEDEQGEQIRARAEDMKGKIELCVKKGGLSYNSMDNLVQFMSF